MRQTSFPWFMVFLRRFSVFIAAVLALIVYIGVYNTTHSAQYATLAIVLALILWIGILILVFRSLKKSDSK
jgi:hypothetical protein